MVQNRVFVSMASGAMFMMSAMSIFSLTSYWLFFFTTEELATVPLQLLQLTLYLFDLLIHVAGSACVWSIREEDQNPVMIHSIRDSALGVSVIQVLLLLFQATNNEVSSASLLPTFLATIFILFLCVQLWKLDQFESRRHMMDSALLLLSISLCFCIGEFVSSLYLPNSPLFKNPGELVVRGLTAFFLLSIYIIWIFDPFFFPKQEKSQKGNKGKLPEGEEEEREDKIEEEEEDGLNGITSREGLELIHLLHLVVCGLSMVTGAQIGFLQLGAAAFVGSCIEIKRISVKGDGEGKGKLDGFHVDMFYRLPAGQKRDLSISF